MKKGEIEQGFCLCNQLFLVLMGFSPVVSLRLCRSHHDAALESSGCREVGCGEVVGAAEHQVPT